MFTKANFLFDWDSGLALFEYLTSMFFFTSDGSSKCIDSEIDKSTTNVSDIHLLFFFDSSNNKFPFIFGNFPFSFMDGKLDSSKKINFIHLTQL